MLPLIIKIKKNIRVLCIPEQKIKKGCTSHPMSYFLLFGQDNDDGYIKF